MSLLIGFILKRFVVHHKLFCFWNLTFDLDRTRQHANMKQEDQNNSSLV